jgi:hypothetical protein
LRAVPGHAPARSLAALGMTERRHAMTPPAHDDPATHDDPAETP